MYVEVNAHYMAVIKCADHIKNYPLLKKSFILCSVDMSFKCMHLIVGPVPHLFRILKAYLPL